MIAAAAGLIRTRGLAKGCLEDPETGGLCMHGALNIAAGVPNTVASVVERCSDPRNMELAAIRSVIREQFPERAGRLRGIVDFNDHQATSEDDVILVLEKAAVRIQEVTPFGGEAA